MELSVKNLGTAVAIAVLGDIDSGTVPVAQQQILALVQPQCRILLDMSKVGFMSSAGLRMLLFVYRQVSSAGGHVVVVGLSDDIKDTMALTGFLDFFKLYDTPEAGLAALP